MFSSSIKTTLLVLLATILAACARPLEESSRVSLSLPTSNSLGKLEALSVSDELNVLIVKVASGTYSRTLHWENCHDCTVPLTPPASADFEGVPTSGPTLIQVIAVYKNSTSGKATFYYGDQEKTFTQALESATVGVNVLGGGSVVMGQVSGRYVTATGVGPTDIIDIAVIPPNGKPGMVVGRSGIYNGWFSAFAFSGVNTEYRLRNAGTNLWNGPVSLNSSPFDPSTDSLRILKAAIPAHKRRNNPISAYHSEEPVIGVWGYWGAAGDITNMRVCRTFQSSFTNIKTYQVTPATLNFNLNATLPSNSLLVDTTTPLLIGTYNGGVDTASVSGSTPCGPSVLSTYDFTKYYSVKNSNLDGNGKDGLAGFYGPFLPTATNRIVDLSTNAATGNKIIAGKIIPDLKTFINKVALFKVNSLGAESTNLDSVDCSTLNVADFLAVGTGSVSISTGAFSFESSITDANAVGSRAVLCPMYNSSYYGAGVYLDSGIFNPYGSAPVNVVATSIVLEKAGTALANYVCTKVKIAGRNGVTPAEFSIGTTFSVTTSDANVGFATSASCSGTAMTLALNSNSPEFYIKVAATGSGTRAFAVTANNGITGVSATINSNDAPGSLSADISLAVPFASVDKHECYPLKMETMDMSTPKMVVNFASSYSILLPTYGSDLTYYSDKTCTTAGSSWVNLGSGVVNNLMTYFKYVGGNTTLNLTPVSGDYSGAYSGNAISLPVNMPGAKAKLSIRAPNNFEQDQCVRVTIRLEDVNGKLADNVSSTSVNLSTDNGAFYSDGDPTCASTSVSSTTIGSGSASVNVFFKSSIVGTASLYAIDSATILSSGSAVVNVNMQSFTTLAFFLPGQTYAGGSGVSGTPNSLRQGIPSLVSLYALRPDGYVDTTLNGNRVTNLSLGGASLVSPANYSLITFINGVATFTILPTIGTQNLNLYAYTMTALSGQVVASRTATSIALAAGLTLKTTSDSHYLNGCQIFGVVPEVSAGEGAGHLLTQASYNIVVSSPDTGAGLIYSDATCSVAVSGNQVITPGTAIQVYYIKVTALGTVNLQVVPVSGGLSGSSVSLPNSSGSATTAKIRVTGVMGSIRQATCQPYILSLSNSTGQSSTSGSSVTMTVSEDHSALSSYTYDDPNCLAPLVGSFTIVPTGYKVIYIKPVDLTSHNIVITGTLPQYSTNPIAIGGP